MNHANCPAGAGVSVCPGGSTVPSCRRPLIARLGRILFMLARCFLIAVLIVGTGSYIVLSPPVLTTLFPGLILCPARTDLSEYNVEALNGIKPEEVYFKNAAANRLHGWFLQSANSSAPVFLFNHGNGGNLALNAPGLSRLLALGVSVFIYDYRGYGKSEGVPTVAGALADGEAAYEYLTVQRKIAPAKIVLFGASFGGSVACHLAARRPAAALFIESTFSSLNSAGRKLVSFFKIYPEWLEPVPALNNSAVLRAKHPPLLIVHGVRDRLIPLSEAEENLAQASRPRTLVSLPNSDHYIQEADLKLYQATISSFLAQLPDRTK
jgi:uncharacterized protein